MYTPEEISTWVSKDWKNLDENFQSLEISGISHDTRTLKEGDVYIAIKGANHDGHDFVEQAFAKGAVAAIVGRDGCPQPSVCPAGGLETDASERRPYLEVSDTKEALWQMAAGVRATWQGPVIGITGSAGKTTVKEMLAAVLSQQGTVAKTPGNWNNDIGLPLSMLAADRNADFFIFEIGMNHPGEIDRLASLLRPDWALITTIGKAHIEFFQSLEKIADEKAAIFKHAQHAVLDADSEWFERLKANFSGSVVTLTEEKFTAPQPGAHMVQNTRFAATLGLELGLSPEQVQAGLNAFEPAPMRWQSIKKDSVVFINDAYNANPLSMRAALSAFAALPCQGRRFAVLGAMHELGAATETEHCELASFADSLGLDRIVYVGSLWPNGIEKNAAGIFLRENLRAGDMVLLKASRGERLETILEKFNR